MDKSYRNSSFDSREKGCVVNGKLHVPGPWLEKQYRLERLQEARVNQELGFGPGRTQCLPPDLLHDARRARASRRAWLKESGLKDQNEATAAERRLLLLSMNRMARRRGLVSYFLTLDPPKEYHASFVVGGGKVSKPNPIFNPLLGPEDGKIWLEDSWEGAQARMARIGMRAKTDYVFARALGMHADSTPHYHILLWIPPEMAPRVEAILKDAGCTYFQQVRKEGGVIKYISRLQAVPGSEEALAASMVPGHSWAASQTRRSVRLWLRSIDNPADLPEELRVPWAQARGEGEGDSLTQTTELLVNEMIAQARIGWLNGCPVLVFTYQFGHTKIAKKSPKTLTHPQRLELGVEGSCVTETRANTRIAPVLIPCPLGGWYRKSVAPPDPKPHLVPRPPGGWYKRPPSQPGRSHVAVPTPRKPPPSAARPRVAVPHPRSPYVVPLPYRTV